MASSLKKSIQIARRNRTITPKLNSWLVKMPSGYQIHDPAVAERIFQLMTPAPNPKGREGAFHPSQLYQCPRAQVFGFLNVDAPKSYNPTLANIFNDGHFRHLRWQIMLLSAGILTDIEVPVESQEYRLEGSMDGLNRNEGWMFELKGTSQFKQVRHGGALPAHIKQVNAYLFATGLEKAIIVYECKSSQEWTEIEVPKDDKVQAEIKSILEGLNFALDNAELPEVKHDCKNQTGTEFNYCPYNSVCLGIKRMEQVATSVQVGRGNPVPKRAARRTGRVRRGADGQITTAD